MDSSCGTSRIAGPIFISMGDKEKLNLFLEKNPYVPRENALVDDYSFATYQAAGFGRFDEVDKDVAKEAMKNMKAPTLGFRGAWDYLTSAGELSPIPKDSRKLEFPEGVLRLGGTFVVNGNEIKYRWSDRLPGDHPDIEKVYQIAEDEASRKKTVFQVPNVFGL
jgi:hypothetical protein